MTRTLSCHYEIIYWFCVMSFSWFNTSCIHCTQHASWLTGYSLQHRWEFSFQMFSFSFTVTAGSCITFYLSVVHTLHFSWSGLVQCTVYSATVSNMSPCRTYSLGIHTSLHLAHSFWCPSRWTWKIYWKVLIESYGRYICKEWNWII